MVAHEAPLTAGFAGEVAATIQVSERSCCRSMANKMFSKVVIVTVMVGVNLIPFHPSILFLAILMPGRAWEN